LLTNVTGPGLTARSNVYGIPQARPGQTTFSVKYLVHLSTTFYRKWAKSGKVGLKFSTSLAFEPPAFRNGARCL